MLISFIFSTLTIEVDAKEVDSKSIIPIVSADSAVLIDATTGEILYSKNKDVAYPPASTTKTMTALLTIERFKLSDVVTVGSNPPLADGSKIYIDKGEKLTVKELLYGMLLPSANDCAEALAEHISGSMPAFVKLMNARAKQLGCKNTNFVNPTGLYNKNHKTSSYDLSLIMRQLVKHSEYRIIATTSAYIIPPTNTSALARPLWNENKLIQKSSNYYYTGCEGGKTGYTIQSEHSYVAAVTRNGQRLIVALVHDKNGASFQEATNLFNYGFTNFELTKLYSKGDAVTTYKFDNLDIPLLATQDFYYVQKKGTKGLPILKFIFKQKNLSSTSFKTVDYLLQANVTIKGKSIGTINLSSGEYHELKPLTIVNEIFNKGTLRIFYSIISILAIAIVILRVRKKIRNKRRNRYINRYRNRKRMFKKRK